MNPIAGIDNPFRSTVVPDPWQPNTDDVPEIQAAAFRACLGALDDSKRLGLTRSVLIYGEPGSGKTHLLRRLRAHWVGEPPHEVDPIRPAVVFVAAKLQASPRHLWRYVRQSLVDDLMRPMPDGTTLLERVLLRRFAEVRPADADLRMWLEWARQEFPGDAFEDFLDDLFDRIDAQEQLGRDLCMVLRHFVQGRKRLDARAWLRGDSLPGSALERLGLAEPEADVDPEGEAAEVVGALCRLAGPGIPVVLTFDQIEALQADREDYAAIHAFGHVIMGLVQSTRNVLIISSVLSTFRNILEQRMLRAAWDRLSMQQAQLDKLGWSEVSALLGSRLRASERLGPLREGKPSLWPFTEGEVQARIDRVGETPRRAISEAARLWDELQSGAADPAPRLDADARISADWELRRAAPAKDPNPREQGDLIERSLRGLAPALSGRHRMLEETGHRDLNLAWAGPGGNVGVHISFEADNRAAWRPFKRLRENRPTLPYRRIVVIRPEGLHPLSPGARGHLDELLRSGPPGPPLGRGAVGARVLSSLLADSRAGDLGDGLGPNTVLEWLRSHAEPAVRGFSKRS
ncbi:MAG: ATP-binding protein [Isosphaeraceae bacterium]